MMTTIRAKFRVVGVTEHDHGFGKTVKLMAVYDPDIPEDQRYAEATPTGSLEMFVNNRAALSELRLGRNFYLDFIPANEPSLEFAAAG